MIIFRYLCKELYKSLLVITLVLLVIFITHQFVHYLRNAASGQITMAAVMTIMSLQIPLLLGYLLPLGLYLSILMTYGRFYVDHEVTILSSCGMSYARWVGMTVLIAFFVMLWVGLLMFWIEPIIQGYRRHILDEAMARVSVQKIAPKRFQALGNRQIFYVDHLKRDKQTMEGVFIAKRPPSGLSWEVTLSKSAKEAAVPGFNGKFIVFHQGHRYLGEAGKKDFQVMDFDYYGIHLPKPAMHLYDWPSGASTVSLWHFIHTTHDAMRLRKASALLQWRLAMPLSVLLFTLLALPLSKVKPRSGKFARLFPAILIYVAYADLMFLGRAWIERGAVSSTMGLWWVHAIALLLSVFLNGCHVGWRRLFGWLVRRKMYANS